MECRFQLFLDGHWVDCAELRVYGNTSVLAYDPPYAFSLKEGLSLKYPVRIDEAEQESLPPFFYDLIPQGAGRKFLLNELKLADGPEADFALACAGAFNPVGQVRIAEAVEYFQHHLARFPDADRDQGLHLEQVVKRSEDFNERMHILGMLASGTTGVQGAAPKFLLTQGHDGLWYGDAVLPDAQAAAHYIVKEPRGRTMEDVKVLRNEAAYMNVARAVGVRTHSALELRGNMLFIPRFDREVRNGSVLRHHQESVASLAGLTGFGSSANLFDIVTAIRSVVTDPIGETIEFLKRDVLNLAMGNKDNHARNTAVQIVDDNVALTPLFDFAPMYLDPEGIARVLRWFHPTTRRQLDEWDTIIEVMSLETVESERIRAELAHFGNEISRLPEIMAEEGVDDDIIEFCRKAIEKQAHQLENLIV